MRMFAIGSGATAGQTMDCGDRSLPTAVRVPNRKTALAGRALPVLQDSNALVVTRSLVHQNLSTHRLVGRTNCRTNRS